MSNNYTKNITLSKAHCNPIYMKILSYILKHPYCTKRDVLASTHKVDIDKKSLGWNGGPFAMLRENKFVDFIRKNKTCLWFCTQNGEAFHYSMRIKRDLEQKIK